MAMQASGQPVVILVLCNWFCFPLSYAVEDRDQVDYAGAREELQGLRQRVAELEALLGVKQPKRPLSFNVRTHVRIRTFSFNSLRPIIIYMYMYV